MLQSTMENVFPAWRTYPKNSMTPSVSEFPMKRIVSFLILGQGDMVQHFRTQPEGTETDIGVKFYTEVNRNGIGEDLVIRFTFTFPAEEISWESVIHGELGEEQLEFVQELSRQEYVFIFVADQFGEMIRIIKLEWKANGDELLKMVTKSKIIN